MFSHTDDKPTSGFLSPHLHFAPDRIGPVPPGLRKEGSALGNQKINIFGVNLYCIENR